MQGEAVQRLADAPCGCLCPSSLLELLSQEQLCAWQAMHGLPASLEGVDGALDRGEGCQRGAGGGLYSWLEGPYQTGPGATRQA